MSDSQNLSQQNSSQLPLPDTKRRRFLVSLTTLIAAVGAVFASVPFISAWLPSARAKAAGGPVQVDLTGLEPGNMMTVEWRGKPVWIIHRTDEMIQNLKSNTSKLRDPESKVEQQPDSARNTYRSLRPEVLVLIGICTHLGCAPTYRPQLNELGPDWPGGFYCPCHGSTFDLAGRVFKGVPAPINLEVPPYHYLNDNTILIGENAKNA
jgi:ubiquinol-cytochrome c reductase iron-sulfur subunit